MNSYFTHVYDYPTTNTATSIAVDYRGETLRHEFVYGNKAFNCLNFITELLWGIVEINEDYGEKYFGSWLERAIASSGNTDTLKRKLVKASKENASAEDLTLFEKKACEELVRFVKGNPEKTILKYLIPIWEQGFKKQAFSSEDFNQDSYAFKNLAEDILSPGKAKKSSRRRPGGI